MKDTKQAKLSYGDKHKNIGSLVTGIWTRKGLEKIYQGNKTVSYCN